MFGSWVLTEIWIIDLSSALVGMLLSSSKSFPLSKEVIVIGTALCYSHQLCCLLYYLGKINSGIYMYQFTLKTLHFCFRMCLWFRIWTKILADRRIWRKKGTDRRICIPLFTPLIKERSDFSPSLFSIWYLHNVFKIKFNCRALDRIAYRMSQEWMIDEQRFAGFFFWPKAAYP